MKVYGRLSIEALTANWVGSIVADCIARGASIPGSALINRKPDVYPWRNSGAKSGNTAEGLAMIADKNTLRAGPAGDFIEFAPGPVR